MNHFAWSSVYSPFNAQMWHRRVVNYFPIHFFTKQETIFVENNFTLVLNIWSNTPFLRRWTVPWTDRWAEQWTDPSSRSSKPTISTRYGTLIYWNTFAILMHWYLQPLKETLSVFVTTQYEVGQMKMCTESIRNDISHVAQTLELISERTSPSKIVP